LLAMLLIGLFQYPPTGIALEFHLHLFLEVMKFYPSRDMFHHRHFLMALERHEHCLQNTSTLTCAQDSNLSVSPHHSKNNKGFAFEMSAVDAAFHRNDNMMKMQAIHNHYASWMMLGEDNQMSSTHANGAASAFMFDATAVRAGTTNNGRYKCQLR